MMKEKSDYQHMISRSVGTKVVGVCASKQNYAAIQGKSMSGILQDKNNESKQPPKQ